jgi:hypothetical protein
MHHVTGQWPVKTGFMSVPLMMLGLLDVFLAHYGLFHLEGDLR